MTWSAPIGFLQPAPCCLQIAQRLYVQQQQQQIHRQQYLAQQQARLAGQVSVHTASSLHACSLLKWGTGQCRSGTRCSPSPVSNSSGESTLQA